LDMSLVIDQKVERDFVRHHQAGWEAHDIMCEMHKQAEEVEDERVVFMRTVCMSPNMSI